MIGEPNRNETAAKVPTGEQSAQLRWRVRPDRPDHEEPETAAQCDQGRLRPDHEAEADRGDRREQHPGQVDRLGGRGLQALGGNVAAVARQASDGERRDHTGEGEHREVPPERGAVIEAEILGDVGEHPPLYVEDQLQEAPRRQGGDHPDHGREEEHGHERPAAQRGLGVGGSWRLGHVDLAHSFARIARTTRTRHSQFDARKVARRCDLTSSEKGESAIGRGAVAQAWPSSFVFSRSNSSSESTFCS